MSKIINHISYGSDHRPAEISGLEKLQLRLYLLDGFERTLLELHINHNASYHRLSEITGKSQKYIARKLRSLIRRLQSEEYITILRHQGLFGPKILEIAYDRYLLGMSARSIAKKRNISRFKVGKMIRILKEWLREKERIKKKG
jgi:transposase-like protein